MADDSSETNFIITIILILIVLNLGPNFFLFPDYAKEVSYYIQFYSGVIELALIGALIVKAMGPKKTFPNLPWVQVVIRFAITYPIFYIIFTVMIGGNLEKIIMPTQLVITQQTIISFLENLLVVILLPYMMVKASSNGYLTVFGQRVPTLHRLAQHIPPVAFITFLHVNAYSAQVSSFNEFYVALIINFCLFMFIFIVFDVIGFGASEGVHAGWNTALTTVRGSII